MTTTEEELFDATQYEIPFPTIDGHKVDDLTLKLGGAINLSRNDPQHTALMESLTLGRRIRLVSYGIVTAKNHSVRRDIEGNELVTHAIGIKIESIEET